MVFLYDLFIRIFVLALRLASLWNQKAATWISGRKSLFSELEKKIQPGDQIIWMHCASAGELEQGKPLIEGLKKQYPAYKILISFFSPSGFHVAGKYKEADIITYLPADTANNAKKFIGLVKPRLVIFIKYEYWYHHLTEIASRYIPLLLVSAIFRKEQVFFKWYGGFYRQMLFLYNRIFVQDKDSCELLQTKKINTCTVSGDTRFDRVKNIAENFSELPLIKEFAGDVKLIVAGSTWPEDETLFGNIPTSVKLIIAPHEITTSHIEQLQKLFPDALLYSSLEAGKVPNVQVLIIDNIGMLSKLYWYATITYIGGGFNKSGIHNTLEAAVYGKPVIFGPNYKKFREARELVDCGGGFSIKNAEELKIKMDHLLHDPVQLSDGGSASENYVSRNTGATNKIIQFIQENRLLTR